MTKYKVVRTYGPGSSWKEKNLILAFDDGWEFVRASDYVPAGEKEYKSGLVDYEPGYIEYILKKEVKEECTCTSSFDPSTLFQSPLYTK